MNATSKNPSGFDSEATGSIRIPFVPSDAPVRALADALTDALTAPAPVFQGGPALLYTHTDGSAKTLIDRAAPGFTLGDDDRLRELAVARALLVHALRLVDRELNR